MKIEIKELENPHYEALDCTGLHSSEALIRINNFELLCNVHFHYALKIDNGDYETPDYKYAILEEVELSDWEFYDLDNEPLDLDDDFKHLVLDEVEKEICKKIDSKI